MTLLNLLILVCFASGMAVISSLIQHYLAKNQSTSRLYLRNCPILPNLAFQLCHYYYLDHTLHLFNIFPASGFYIREYFTTIPHVPEFFSLKGLFDKLDDIIDGAVADKVLSFGKVILGPTPSPFLQKLLDKDDLHDLDQFVAKGLIKKEDMYAFGNLLANKLYIQSELTLEYQAESSAEKKALIREKISKEHLEVSGIYLVFIIHLVKKDKRIFDIVGKDMDNELTYDDLKKIYPSGVKEGELMQIAHDMIEFRLDLRQEPIIGKITPNYFLAQLEKNGILAAAMEKLNSLPDRPVSFHELPTSIQKIYLEVGKHYRTQSLTIGYIAWAVNSLTWQYERMVGFFTEKP